MESTGQPDILRLVDLKRYPIDNIETGRGAEFARECAEHMETYGWCNLDGFVHAEGLEELAREANELLPNAENLTIKRSIYGGEADEGADEGDPRRHEITHKPLQLADDQLPRESLIQQLYHCDRLTDFIRVVQGKKELYRYDDEFQALNIVALPPGGWHGWHYDYNECTVTLLIQAAEEGGEFTFLPDVRTNDSRERETVDRFLKGDMRDAKTFSRGAGTLTLFRGERSLHGVTRVEGTQPRITAILTYDEIPNRVADDAINIQIYGKRVAQILAERQR
ncbi:MAG: hypothetical protein AAF362_20845 [Pseudomonadota bacterium]